MSGGLCFDGLKSDPASRLIADGDAAASVGGGVFERDDSE